MSEQTRHFRALRVEEQQEADTLRYVSVVAERSYADLPAGEVLIKVHYSSLNYKDALSAAGNKGVTRHYPHTPGVDAAGVVVSSGAATIAVGTAVIVTGYDLGMNTAGGFAEYIRVPAQWVLPLPAGLSLFESMILGTAGLSAGLCVEKLLRNGLTPDAGEVLVTGATGGVGSIAVALLAKLGFHVVACSGKADQHAFLEFLGASAVLSRHELMQQSSRALLAERWAGAVDVVGGDMLSQVIKTLRYGASVACCGLVGAAQLETTVFPFILRSVNLLGVDSVQLPLSHKTAMWQRLAQDWKPVQLSAMARVLSFDELEGGLASLLQGQVVGRLVLDTGR